MKGKKELRKEILQKRDALSVEEHRQKSEEIAKKVITSKAFEQANVILLFASYKSEVDTKAIFEAAIGREKAVYYPKVHEKEMEFYRVLEEADLLEGFCGIREPEVNDKKRYVPTGQEIVCVIMPGAVFDAEGNRIGYGGGYYDKYLQSLEHKIAKEKLTKLAIAFECQLIEAGKIQSELHDKKPDCIITEAKIY